MAGRGGAVGGGRCVMPAGLRCPARVARLMSKNCRNDFRLTFTGIRRKIGASVFEYTGTAQNEQEYLYNANYYAIAKRSTVLARRAQMIPSIATQLPRPEVNIDVIFELEELRLDPIEQSLWKIQRKEFAIEEAEKHYQGWECRVDDTSAGVMFTIKGPDQTKRFEVRPAVLGEGSYLISPLDENDGDNERYSGNDYTAVEVLNDVQSTFQVAILESMDAFIRQLVTDWKRTITLQDVLKYVLDDSSIDSPHDGKDGE